MAPPWDSIDLAIVWPLASGQKNETSHTSFPGMGGSVGLISCRPRSEGFGACLTLQIRAVNFLGRECSHGIGLETGASPQEQREAAEQVL